MDGKYLSIDKASQRSSITDDNIEIQSLNSVELIKRMQPTIKIKNPTLRDGEDFSSDEENPLLSISINSLSDILHEGKTGGKFKIARMY